MKLSKLLDRAIYCFWGVSLCIIWALIAFFGKSEYAAKVSYNNAALAVCGVLLAAVLYFVISRVRFTVKFRAIAVIGFLFCLFQVYFTRLYFFRSDWDIQAIFWAAEEVEIPGLEVYFSNYPNNILLTYFFHVLLTLCGYAGIYGNDAYFMTIVFQCVISYVTGLLTFYTAQKLSSSDKTAAFVYIMYLLLIGLSPWVSIPYSDSTGLFFPSAILALYVSKPEKPCLTAAKWLLIGLLAYVGFKIKPTVLIVLIAVAIVRLPYIADRQRRKALLRGAAFCAVGLALGSGIFRFAYNRFSLEIDPEARFGMAHFLAMGLDEETMGVYNQDYISFSSIPKTNRERDAVDWSIAKETAAQMGPVRLLKQFGRKILTNFNDGSFAWTQEGTFFKEVFERNDAPARFARSFYYTDGSRFDLFRSFEQSVWLSVLFFSLFSVLHRRGDACAVLMLTLTGFFIYGILFEARARYVYIFVPLFLILAGMGIAEAEKLIRKLYAKAARTEAQ